MPILTNNQSLLNTSVYTGIYLDSNKCNRTITAASISWPKSSPF